MGISKAGENIYGNPDDLFFIFTAQPNEFAAFHFIMQVTAFHFIKHELTPTPTAMPTEKWQILIYHYETDGVYFNQPAVATYFQTDVIPYTDRLLMYMTADISMESMQTEFGDCSAFTYQVIDEQGKIQQQGNFSINPYLLFRSGGGLIGDINIGITLGYPYSLNEKETEFFHQGKFIVIDESKSGFYRLTYSFNFIGISGVYGTADQEELASELTLKLFAYRDDGDYTTNDFYPAEGILHSGAGMYRVNLPIDYLRENASGKNKYYLQIVDGKGKIIREEYFLFVPHTP